MERFAELLDRLGTTTQRNGKIRLLANYFRAAPDPDRGFALAALTDGLPLSFPMRRILAEIIEPHVDPELYRLSRDYVGDTAETIALLWPGPAVRDPPPGLSEIVRTIEGTSRREMPRVLSALLDRLDASGRWALLKFLGGALRVGVSARLAKIGLAQAMAAQIEDIEEIWHALKPPFGPLFDWLEGRGPRPDFTTVPIFRPMMLSHAIEDSDFTSINPGEVIAEWKWDGIRVQIASAGDEVRVFSRTGDDVSPAFPDVAEAFRCRRGVLDGELLVMSEGEVMPFNNLQQRLNRKAVSSRLIERYPAHVRLYDLLFDGAEDIRAMSLEARRRQA